MSQKIEVRVVNTPPAHAERVEFMAVMGTRERPSQFAPSVKALVSTMKCVGCDTVNDDPGVGQVLKCNCGLSTLCTGAGVYIWRHEPATAERV